MINYIKTNCNLIIDKINIIKQKSKIIKHQHKCPICGILLEFKYKYLVDIQPNDVANSQFINVFDLTTHMLKKHNMIEITLYEQISKIIIDNYPIIFNLLNTNGLNILDGLYEEGSNKIYIEKSSNINNSKIKRYSEHHGFIYFLNSIIDRVVVLNNYRLDKHDSRIYMPKNSLEALDVNYIFHTHPKTPYAGSRTEKNGIYEFPSVCDIIHFVDHHNNGKLQGSLIVAPEGIYIIRKYIFDLGKIKLDEKIFTTKYLQIHYECSSEAIEKYPYNYQDSKIKYHIKIPDEYFYPNISQNFEYINRINKVLMNYDIYIDYYPRTNLPKTDKWIFDNIYVPITQ